MCYKICNNEPLIRKKPLDDYFDNEGIFNNNKELNKAETEGKNVVLKSRPISLMVVLTRACNLRCIMCPRVKGTWESIPFELIRKIYAFFPYLELIDWQGGEVFFLDYFKELLLEAASYQHISQYITTNGLLIDKEWAKLLTEVNANLLFSIDSVDKDIYESIRVGGKFKDLLKNLDLLNESKKKYNSNSRLGINAIVMKRNYKTLRLFPDFCRKNNFTLLNFDALMPDLIPEEDIVTNPDSDMVLFLDDMFLEVEEECMAYGIQFNCSFGRRIKNLAQGLRGDNTKECLCVGRECGNFETDCSHPWQRLHIEPGAQVYPACQCKVSIGSLKDDTLENIWNSRIMRLYRNLILDNNAGGICSAQCKFYKRIGREGH